MLFRSIALAASFSLLLESAANKKAAEKRKKDSEEAYKNQVEAIRGMEDESINLISNDYERETLEIRLMTILTNLRTME